MTQYVQWPAQFAASLFQLVLRPAYVPGFPHLKTAEEIVEIEWVKTTSMETESTVLLSNNISLLEAGK